MNDLYSKVLELRPLLRPVAEYAVWPVYFLITRAISQEPLYLLALLLVLAADLIDAPRRDRALTRDFAAGAMTALLALAVNYELGLVVGAVVGFGAVARLLLKSA